ncbi:MAG: retropepsin-like aspartic protease family protein [Chroococcales cyanobacterium]
MKLKSNQQRSKILFLNISLDAARLTPMKPLLSALIVTTGVLLFPLTAFSQEQAGCFMIDGGGQQLDLTGLCEGQSADAILNVYTLPIKYLAGGIPVVDVTFNGRQTYEMLLDTGASVTAVTPQMAQALKVVPQQEITVATAGGTVPATLGSVRSAAAGGASVNNLQVVISNNLPMGLLGQNFFGGYDVTIKEDVIELRYR